MSRKKKRHHDDVESGSAKSDQGSATHSIQGSQHSVTKGVPHGLESLVNTEAIYVQQELEVVEILLSFETKNRYQIVNDSGQVIFYAGESSGCCARNCFGRDRAFAINLVNFQGQPVITMVRSCNCGLCFWGANCAGSNIEVKSAITGELYGKVIQNCSWWTPSFTVYDSKGRKVMIIEGPCGSSACSCRLCCNAMFSLYLLPDAAAAMGIKAQRLGVDIQKRHRKPSNHTRGKVLIGGILKKFKAVEFISDANSFGVQYSPKLDPRLKAVLIGATFCIDFSYFESDCSNSTECGCGIGFCCLILFLNIAITIAYLIFVGS